MATHQNAATLGIALDLQMGNFATEAQKVAYETQKMKNAIAREMKAADKEIQSLKYATEDYGKAVSKVTQIERELATGRLKDIKGSAKAQELLAQAAAYDKVAASARNAAGAQFKMNEQQKIQLTYQTTDLFTQIASGQSPFIAIIQQGGQLKDAMGGIGNMFRAIGSLFTPFSVGLGTVAVAVGSVSYALYKAVDDLDKFKDAMTLTGNFAGVTYDKLLNLGNVLSDKTNASIGDARDVMQQLAATGKYTATSIEAVGEVVLRFAKISGVDAAKAAETLIPLLDGTASSAKQLNDKYHFLTLEQYKNIEALEKQGRLQEAAKLQATLLNESLQSTQRELGNLEKAWQGVANFASQAWDAMMGWGRENGTERAKELEKLINEVTQEIENRRARGLKTGSQEAAIKAFRTELNAIVSKEMAALDAAEAASKKAKEEQDKIKAYSGAGGIGKQIEIQSAISKALAKGQYILDVEIANERQKIELDAAKEINEKKLEFDKKSAEERRAFGGLLARQLNAEILAIELDRDVKIRNLRQKTRLSEYEEYLRTQKEITDAEVAESNRRQTIRTSNQSRTRDMEYQKESLDLKYQLIYATEKEQRLAQISLEYARKRKEVEEGPDKQFNLDQIDRQEQMAKMFIVMEEGAKRTQQVFDSVWGNLSSAIDNFVKTGKLNMKDFARSVIQDLIAIQMKAAALRFLGSMFSSFASGTSSYNASGGIAEHVFNPNRADGGPVDGGKIGLVGERGPELFVPRTAGTIIPNHALAGMGGQTINYNGPIIQNMSAIDTQSAMQFLAKNKQGVWAANQSAQRSMPVSR